MTPPPNAPDRGRVGRPPSQQPPAARAQTRHQGHASPADVPASPADPLSQDIIRVLFTREQIQARVRALAQEIAAAYNGDGPGLTLVPILSGSIIFLADLIRELPLKMKIALVRISTYPGQSTAARSPRTVLQLSGAVRGREVLVVDDIFDTGRTLRTVHTIIRGHAPASLRTCVLLRKPAQAPPDVRVDFVGFDVEDQFVVGYGLDYGDLYRNYPHIGVLRPELLL